MKSLPIDSIKFPAKAKKRRRWTREEKRHRSNGNNNSSPNKSRPPDSAAIFGSLLRFAEQHRYTECVKILRGSVESTTDPSDQEGEDTRPTILTVGKREFSNLWTGNTLPSSLPSNVACIAVKPLLILDINGILCHRVRHEDQNPHLSFRPAVKKVNGTPIIVRPSASIFLNFLSQHFCLAIWTSAKAKTARLILRAVVQPDVRNKLLFVWSQKHCRERQPVRDDQQGDDRHPVFMKSLQQVYDYFPLWGPCNTVLVDDSPEKCHSSDSLNTLHPPSLHGKSITSATSTLLMSDEDNHEKQSLFFGLLADHFNTRSVLQANSDEDHLSGFFRQHAQGHMGWRGTKT
eukprot:scaffold1138_cov128-Cylindrotheca_fusiformis.AAC.29